MSVHACARACEHCRNKAGVLAECDRAATLPGNAKCLRDFRPRVWWPGLFCCRQPCSLMALQIGFLARLLVAPYRCLRLSPHTSGDISVICEGGCRQA